MMKAIKPLILVAVLFTLACKKDNVKPTVLTGKWKIIGGYSSSGGPPTFEKVPADNNEYIQFGSDRKFQSTVITYKDFVGYEIKSDREFTLFHTDNNTALDHPYSLKNDTLDLHFKGAIEGAGLLFVKVK
jgi:hypothetical protein